MLNSHFKYGSDDITGAIFPVKDMKFLEFFTHQIINKYSSLLIIITPEINSQLNISCIYFEISLHCSYIINASRILLYPRIHVLML